MTDYTLASGKGSGEQLCAMQRAALIHAQTHGYVHLVDTTKIITDRPCWANAAVTGGVVRINDLLDDVERQRLKPIVERALLTCTRNADPEIEKRINVRVAVLAARSVLPGNADPSSVAAIEAAEGWLDGTVTTEECRAAAVTAAAASYAASASSSAYASSDAAAAASSSSSASSSAAAYAASASSSAYASSDALVTRASDLVDAWEKAAAAEGALLDDSWRTIVESTFDIELTQGAL